MQRSGDAESIREPGEAWAINAKNIDKGTVLTYNLMRTIHLPLAITMTELTDTKQERINLRLKHSAKRALERAASFEGKTVSNFILASALENAEKTIHEHEVMTLNRRDSEVFFNALVKPARFNKKLEAALEEHDQRVTSE